VSRHAKFIAALAASVAIIGDAMVDGVFASVEVEAIALSLVGAVFVFLVKNDAPDIA
jgi:hypothetical protein